MNRYAYRCQICGEDPAHHDYAVVSWTCMDPHHLTRTALALQRAGETTRLTLTQVDEEEEPR